MTLPPSSLDNQQMSSTDVQYGQSSGSSDNINLDQFLLPDAVRVQDLIIGPSMIREWDTTSQPEASHLLHDYYESMSDIDVCTHEEGFGIIEEFFPSHASLKEIPSVPLQLENRTYASLKHSRQPEPCSITCTPVNEDMATEMPTNPALSHLGRGDMEQECAQGASISERHEAGELAAPHTTKPVDDVIKPGPRTTIPPHARCTKKRTDTEEDDRSTDSRKPSLLGTAEQLVEMSSDLQDPLTPFVAHASQGQDVAVNDRQGQDETVVGGPKFVDSPLTLTPVDSDMPVPAMESCMIPPGSSAPMDVARSAFETYVYAGSPNELDREPAAGSTKVATECDASTRADVLDACKSNQTLFELADELIERDIGSIDNTVPVEATSPGICLDVTLTPLHIEDEADRILDGPRMQATVSPPVGPVRQCLTRDIAKSDPVEWDDCKKCSVSIISHDNAQDDEDVGFQGNEPCRTASPPTHSLPLSERPSHNKSPQHVHTRTADVSTTHLESTIDKKGLPPFEAPPHESFIEKAPGVDLKDPDDASFKPLIDVNTTEGASLTRDSFTPVSEHLESSKFAEPQSSPQTIRAQQELPMETHSKVRLAANQERPNTPPATPLREPDFEIEQELTSRLTLLMASLELHSPAMSAVKDSPKRSLAVADPAYCKEEGTSSQRQKMEPSYERVPKEAPPLNETVADSRDTSNGGDSISMALDVIKVFTRDDMAVKPDSETTHVTIDNGDSSGMVSTSYDNANPGMLGLDRAVDDGGIGTAQPRDQAMNTVTSIERSSSSHHVTSPQICGPYVQTADAGMQERINTVSVSPSLQPLTLLPNVATEITVPHVQTTDAESQERVYTASVSPTLAASVSSETPFEEASSSLQAFDADVQERTATASISLALTPNQPDISTLVEALESNAPLTDVEMQERICTASASPSLAASVLPPDTTMEHHELNTEADDQKVVQECKVSESALVASTALVPQQDALAETVELNVQTVEIRVQQPSTTVSEPSTPSHKAPASAETTLPEVSITRSQTSEPTATCSGPPVVSSSTPPSGSPTTPRSVRLKFKPLKRPKTPVESAEATSVADERSNTDQASVESEEGEALVDELSANEPSDSESSEDSSSDAESPDVIIPHSDSLDGRSTEEQSTKVETLGPDPPKLESTQSRLSEVERANPSPTDSVQSQLTRIESKKIQLPDITHQVVASTTPVSRDNETQHTDSLLGQSPSLSSQSSDLSSIPATELAQLSDPVDYAHAAKTPEGESSLSLLPDTPSPPIKESTPPPFAREGFVGVEEVADRGGSTSASGRASTRHEAEFHYGRRATRSTTQTSDHSGGAGGDAIDDDIEPDRALKEEEGTVSVSSLSGDGDGDGDGDGKGTKKKRETKTKPGKGKKTSILPSTIEAKKQTRAQTAIAKGGAQPSTRASARTTPARSKTATAKPATKTNAKANAKAKVKEASSPAAKTPSNILPKATARTRSRTSSISRVKTADGPLLSAIAAQKSLPGTRSSGRLVSSSTATDTATAAATATATQTRSLSAPSQATGTVPVPVSDPDSSLGSSLGKRKRTTRITRRSSALEEEEEEMRIASERTTKRGAEQVEGNIAKRTRTQRE